jgi:O-antigen/teichoic acid export membrane protein
MIYYDAVLTVISIISILVIPFLIKLVLPEYKNGINASIILLLSMYILGTNGITVNIITGYKKAKQLTLHMFIAFGLFILIECSLINILKIDAISIALVAFNALSFKAVTFNTFICRCYVLTMSITHHFQKPLGHR